MFNWLFTPSEPQLVDHKLASRLLQALCFHLPDGYSRYQRHLDNGQSLFHVLGDIGLSLGQLIGQQKTRIQQLEQECLAAKNDLWWANRQRETLISDPLRQQLSEAQAEIKTLSARAEKTERALDIAQQLLSVEQAGRQQEENRLKAIIAEQNHVIARQQLRLNELLGDSPSAESTGGKRT
jgi:hypothetical protein